MTHIYIQHALSLEVWIRGCERKKAVEAALRAFRKSLRREEFKPIWESFAILNPGAQDPKLMPKHNDAFDFAAVQQLLAGNDWRLTVTQEQIRAITAALTAEIESFRTKFLRGLANLATRAKRPMTASAMSTFAKAQHRDADVSILNRAWVFFKSLEATRGRGVVQVKLLTYRDVLSYPHTGFYAQTKSFLDPRVMSGMFCEPEIKRIALLLLGKLGLNEDTTHAEMKKWDRRLLCLCGHPDFLRPMGFTDLVKSLALLSFPPNSCYVT